MKITRALNAIFFEKKNKGTSSLSEVNSTKHIKFTSYEMLFGSESVKKWMCE